MDHETSMSRKERLEAWKLQQSKGKKPGDKTAPSAKQRLPLKEVPAAAAKLPAKSAVTTNKVAAAVVKGKPGAAANNNALKRKAPAVAAAPAAARAAAPAHKKVSSVPVATMQSHSP